MRKTTLKALAVVVIMAMAGLTCSQSAKTSADRLNVGDEAPLFSLPMLEGSEEVVMAKVIYNAWATVLVFWSMTCPSCREALLECQQVYGEFEQLSTAFYGINYDTQNTQAVRAFLKGEAVTIPHLWDRGQRTTKNYKALDYTFSVFVIDREGKVVLAQYDHPPDLADVLRETLKKTLPAGE
jgi:peroxiredoxin